MAGQKVKPAADLHPAELAAAVFSEHCQSLLEAESRLERFERTGHGLFIWQAYKSAREASGSKDAARVAMDALGLPDDISARLDAVMTRVLGLLDLIASEMVKTAGVTGTSQAAALRRALLIDRQSSPAKSRTLELREQIIDLYRGLVVSTKQYRSIYTEIPPEHKSKAPKPISRADAYRIIANRVECTERQVRKIYDLHIKPTDPDTEVFNEVELSPTEPSPASPSRTPTRRRPRAPSKSHRWRAPLK